MSVANTYSLDVRASSDTTLARAQLLSSLRDADYRHEFVKERVRSSVALQIRALRKQRNDMTQEQLGDDIGMKQTWISKLENPEYGKMTVATLLRLAEAFDTDLEIKFRPFSKTVDELPRQDSGYFDVPSFEEEFGEADAAQGALDLALVAADQVPQFGSQSDSAGWRLLNYEQTQVERRPPGREDGTARRTCYA